ncbi:MAG: methyl-accepting chemotaxis protein [Syntrophomonadaceae bacterium]|nr:methyl-accepting chemotaxis protein [Syntrophomonadaceae bacterium]MDD3889001.1 methyl-accepting chemotaxis protein [Syntrophomonadaceae bacterium]MDD4548300.1 methyl-accepting chemotaxis protein [Syntrophomonadaceae bacterium]
MMIGVERLLRKIDVRWRLIVAFTIILIGVTGMMGIYATTVMSEKIMLTAQEKLKSDLALGEQIIETNYPGDWKLVDGVLYKGNILMENNNSVVDRIGELTGDTVTIFKYDTRVSTNVKKDNKRQIGTKVSENVAQAVLDKGETYIGRANVVGTWNETAYKPIKDTQGRIIGIWYVGVPATPYDALITHFRTNMIIYSGIGIFIGFLAAFLIAYTVYRPLKRIEEAVELTSQGDFTRKVPVNAKDDVGRLAIKINVMIEQISELISKAQNLILNVSASSAQLQNNSEMSAGLMQGMTGKANEMSQNAASQADLTGKSKMAIGDMSAAIQQVAENAQEVSETALTATNRAEEGEKQVEKAISQINIISETVNSTATTVEGLGSKSQEIGQIVDLITNIATQTNLLALNAAIEAARAGDQGKGFAVVAEEVRVLAEESGEAAKRIANLIKEIQNEAHKAVGAMQEGTKEVANGTEVVASAGEAFQHIIQAITVVNDQIQEMSGASQEMAASAETAIESIEQTNNAAEENLASAEDISRIAGEQMAGIEEVTASIEKLNNIVHELETAISYFKI